MNWIEIDKILHNLYSAWDGENRDDYYRMVERQFKWDRRQAITATDLIFKQRQKHDNASSSGNDLKPAKKKKTVKEDSKPVASRSRARSVSEKAGSRASNTASRQKRSEAGNKPAAGSKRRTKANQ